MFGKKTVSWGGYWGVYYPYPRDGGNNRAQAQTPSFLALHKWKWGGGEVDVNEELGKPCMVSTQGEP